MGGYNRLSPSRVVVAREERFQAAMLKRRTLRSKQRAAMSANAWQVYFANRLESLPRERQGFRDAAIALFGGGRCERRNANGNRVMHDVSLRVTLVKTGKRQALLSAINRSPGWNLDEQIENLRIRRASLLSA